MAIQRWSPFADLRRAEDVFNRMWASREAYEPEAWRIPLDVTKDNDNIVVTASLPGVTADQIEAKVDDGVLTIRADRYEPFSHSAAALSPSSSWI